MTKHFDPGSPVSAVLGSPEARAILQQALPGVLNSPMAAHLRTLPIGPLVERDRTLADDPAARARLWERLAAVEDRSPGPDERVFRPDPAFEADDVPRASATASFPKRVDVHEVFQLDMVGPAHGNPFVGVELHAEFTSPNGTTVVVGGFYDGDGRYAARYLPPSAGRWTFTTRSTARPLDGLRGSVEVIPASRKGPGRVDGFHFRHADGSRYLPIGTTAYTWTHQADEIQERTLAALARAPFTKPRMCLSPKSYLYNTNEPSASSSPGTTTAVWTARFDTRYFAHLEQRLARLAELGVEADLILFHPYDRWGFSDLGPAVDDRYVRYVVRRLGAFPNVWWSLANEYDLLCSNCSASTPTGPPRTPTSGGARWDKPVVVDECGYEGDLDQGWGVRSLRFRTLSVPMTGSQSCSTPIPTPARVLPRPDRPQPDRSPPRRRRRPFAAWSRRSVRPCPVRLATVPHQ